MRNLGGSVGIAIVSTIMTEETQDAWNPMGGHISPFNAALPRYLDAAGLGQGNLTWQVLDHGKFVLSPPAGLVPNF